MTARISEEEMPRISDARIAVWEREGRSFLWQAWVEAFLGADAVDDHALSIADAERLADAALRVLLDRTA